MGRTGSRWTSQQVPARHEAVGERGGGGGDER